MASSIEYIPQQPKVDLNNVCYKTSPTGDIHHGFLRSVTLGEEALLAEIVQLVGSEFQAVPGAVQTDCPMGGSGPTTTTIFNNIVFFRHRVTNVLVYSILIVGTVNFTYYNIDGSLYLGDVQDLDIAGDVLNYSSPELLCANGTESLTRVDVWNEHREKLVSIWQDLRGNIISEPIGTLKAGSCDRPMTVEALELVDNFRDTDNDPTGQHVLYMQWIVSEPSGAIATSTPRLDTGAAYLPIGITSRTPLLPPLKSRTLRLTNNQTWKGDKTCQSYGWATERCSTANPVSIGDTELTAMTYKGGDSVDGSDDPYIETPLIKAWNQAKVLITHKSQPRLINVTGLPLADILDTLIPIPDDLTGGDSDSGSDGGGD
jgi:hypothetical protein